jgi:hypothetical protein
VSALKAAQEVCISSWCELLTEHQVKKKNPVHFVSFASLFFAIISLAGTVV